MSGLHNYYRQLGLWGSADGSYFSSISPGNPTYQPVFERSFRTMRAFTQFGNRPNAYPRPETSPPADRWRLKCFGQNTASNSATDAVIPYRTYAANYKGVAILAYHALASTDTKHVNDGGVLTAFEKTLEWLDANRATIEVVTLDTWIKRAGAA